MKTIREEIATGNKPAPAAKENVAPKGIPAWFGGDEADWASFLNHNERLAKESEDRIMNRLKEAKGKEEDQIKEATDYMSSEISAIQSDSELNPKGTKVDKNKLLEFVMKNDLVDSKGRWNYRAGWRMMNAATVSAKPKVNKDRKDLAGATLSEKSGETKQADTTSSKDFENPSNRP